MNSSRNSWLHGHRRTGGVVLLGSSVHCAGCGVFRGTTTVEIGEIGGWIPDSEPDWPFDEHDCPVCSQLLETGLTDKLTARLLALQARKKRGK